MKFNVGFIISLCLVLVIAFLSEDLKSGVVTAKTHEPEKDCVAISLFVTGDGDVLPINVLEHKDAYWMIRIEGDLRGRHRARDIYVSQDTYDKVSIGDFYTVTR